jgi:hypothetical protein
MIAIFTLSCKKEEEQPPSGFQYGPGNLIYFPGIEMSIDTNHVHFDYCFSRLQDFQSGFNKTDSTISIDRSISYPGNRVSIDGGNLSLENLNYPITFWPGIHSETGPWLIFKLQYNNAYSTKLNDTTQFSITLTGFSNDRLTGTFQGKLYDVADTTSFVTITSGQLYIKMYISQ